MDGYAAIREQLSGERVDEVLACSSAGGGLRLAVVGYEREVTAEAGSPGGPVGRRQGRPCQCRNP